MAREATLQQRDPVSSHVSHNIGSVAAIGVPTITAGAMLVNGNSIVSQALAVASFVVIVAVGAYIAIMTNSMRAPFRARSLVVIVVALLIAIVLGTVSMWGANASLRNDWGPPSAGLYLLALTAYRPPRELALAGGFMAVVVGVFAIAQAEFVETPGTVGVLVVGAMAPLIIATIIATAFSHVVLGEVFRWEREAERALGSLTKNGREWMSRSVQQDRVTILNQEVVPLLASILSSGRITERDQVAAIALSETIRNIMVAEVNRSWLDGVVEQARARRGYPPATRAIVRDERRLADHMTVHQRTAVRALLDTLHGAPGCDPDSLHLTISNYGRGYVVALRAELDGNGASLKLLVEPYLAVVQVMFRDVQVEAGPRSLTVQFSYGNR